MDAFHSFSHRIVDYLNPFAFVRLLSREAKSDIQNEKEIDLYDTIDALSEVAVKALQRSNISLCNQVVDELQLAAKRFLESSKSISHHEQDKDTKALGISDKASFTVFYLLQRYELIGNKAIEQKLDTACSTLISSYGKIILYAAKYDMSIAGYPIHFLGRFAQRAQKAGISEAGVKATLTLVEAAKTLIQEIDISYYDLKDPFLSLIANLEAIAKEAFRQDKSIDLQILMQPFADLKTLFQSEKTLNHPDQPIILENIQRVLGEFEALQATLLTLPPIPKMEEETS